MFSCSSLPRSSNLYSQVLKRSCVWAVFSLKFAEERTLKPKVCLLFPTSQLSNEGIIAFYKPYFPWKIRTFLLKRLNEDLDPDSQMLTYITSQVNVCSVACIGCLKDTGAVPLAEKVSVSTWQCRVGCSSLIAGACKAWAVICLHEQLCQQIVIQRGAT